MEEQVIYLKGKATGYYKPRSINNSGHYQFSSIDFQTIDIKDSTVIDYFNANELKIGFYHEFSTRVGNARVFINETEYLQESIDELLLTDLLIGELIFIDGEPFYEYSATAFYVVKKKQIETTKKVLQSLPIFNIIKKSSFKKKESNKTLLFEKSVENETIVVDNDTSIVWRNFLNSIFGSFIISLIGFFVLYTLFGLTTFTWLIPIFFFLVMILEGVNTNFPDSYFSLNQRYSFLNFIGWIILFCSLYLLFKYGFALKYLLLTFLGLGLILVSRLGRIINFIGGLLALLALAFFIYRYNYFDDKKTTKQEDIVERNDTDNNTDDNWDYKPRESIDTTYSENKDTITLKYLKHNLTWNDNSQKTHQALFVLRKDFYNISKIKHNQLQINADGFREYYYQIYSNLISQNKTFLDSIVKEYALIGKKENLDRIEFADMVVTSIQNIPYYLVHDLSHQEADYRYGGFISKYHQTGKPCLDKIKFGVQAPAEFMADFKGDCDTRSLFLFHILSKFGYSVAMLGSEQYSHCIIGISGNYSGDFVSYKGLKYYVWETTVTKFTPGNLSPECGNMRYWSVVLAN